MVKQDLYKVISTWNNELCFRIDRLASVIISVFFVVFTGPNPMLSVVYKRPVRGMPYTAVNSLNSTQQYMY